MGRPKLLVLLSLLLLGHASGQRVGPRIGGRRQGLPSPNPFQSFNADSSACLQLPVVQDFQAEKYLGRWYEIARFLNQFQSGSCVTADYSLLPNCSIGVTNTQILPDGWLNSIEGFATSAGNPATASLTVSFPGQAPPSEGNYNVISTDYSSYAVVYSCSVANFGGRDTKFEFSWILSRTPLVSPVFLQRLESWLLQLGVRTDKYIFTRQIGCLYV